MFYCTPNPIRLAALSNQKTTRLQSHRKRPPSNKGR